MKKLWLLPLLLLLPLALAQEEGTIKAGIAQGNIFYSLDLAMEKLQLAFTFDEFHKAQRELQFSEERLAEMEKLAKKKNNEERILKTKERYEKQWQKLGQDFSKFKNEEDKELAMKLMEAKMQQHILVLTNLKNVVPEPAMKGIDTAIENSQKYKTMMKEGKATW